MSTESAPITISSASPAPLGLPGPGVVLPLKTLARKALARAATGIPVRARRALMQALAPDGDFTMFQTLAKGAGVQGLRVAGAYGVIEGSIYDHAILARYAQTKTWCEAENQFFVRFFAQRGAGTYLDIGANLGLTTIPVAQNPAVSCLAFEPEPVNFEYLRANVLKNCTSGNVQLLNLALFDRAGTLDFELSERNMGDHRVRLAATAGAFEEDQRAVIRVRAQPLDAVIDRSSLKRPLAAKVIAQGAEAHIVGGGRAILSEAEAMVIEYYPYAMRRLQGDVAGLIDFVGRHFGSAALVAGGTDQPLAWTPPKAVSESMQALAEPDAATPYEYFHIFLMKEGAGAMT